MVIMQDSTRRCQCFVNIVQHGIFCCMCFCLVLLINYLPFTAPNAVTYMQVTKPAVFHPFARAKNMVPSTPVSPCCSGKCSGMYLSNRPVQMPNNQITCL